MIPGRRDSDKFRPPQRDFFKEESAAAAAAADANKLAYCPRIIPDHADAT